MKYLINKYGFVCVLIAGICSCKKSSPIKVPVNTLNVITASVNGTATGSTSFKNITFNPQIKISFSAPLDTTTVAGNVEFFSPVGNVPVVIRYSNNDSTILVQPVNTLTSLTSYTLRLLQGLKSTEGGELSFQYSISLTTQIDTTNKFPVISDSALLTLVQQQTFQYFWDFGHPVSGMARERTTSGDVVTTGGSGFGVMAILVGIQRNFITRPQGLARITTIVNFLINNAHDIMALSLTG